METRARSAAAFRTTRWSVVARAAAAAAHPQTRAAVADLCGDCWPPLCAFARHLGHAPQDAESFTQSFFVFFIEKNFSFFQIAVWEGKRTSSSPTSP